MSDHDPIDQTYASAETLLADDAERAARRARVLAAVAAEAAPARRRSSWGRGGWLMAACVAGVAAILAVQLSPSADIRQGAPPAEAPEVAAPASETASEPLPSPVVPPAPIVAAPPPPRIASREALQSVPEAQAPPAPPPVVAPAPLDVTERAATAQRAEAAPSAGRSLSMAPEAASAPSPDALNARLRAAAAAGRTGEVTALLAEGATVDSPDLDGETALMKSVRANHPAVVSLLRRRGADPDLRNRRGVSARQMAASIGDPELDRALGLIP